MAATDISEALVLESLCSSASNDVNTSDRVGTFGYCQISHPPRQYRKVNIWVEIFGLYTLVHSPLTKTGSVDSSDHCLTRSPTMLQNPLKKSTFSTDIFFAWVSWQPRVCTVWCDYVNPTLPASTNHLPICVTFHQFQKSYRSLSTSCQWPGVISHILGPMLFASAHAVSISSPAIRPACSI